MSAIKSPLEKKANAYSKDHYIKGGESDKAFRRKWPIKKKKAARSLRRRANIWTRKAAEGKEDVPLSSLKQVKLRKWGQIALRDFVNDRREARAERSGGKERRRTGRL